MSSDTSPSPTSTAVDPSLMNRARDRALTRWFWRHYVRKWLPFLLLAVLLMAVDGAMTGMQMVD